MSTSSLASNSRRRRGGRSSALVIVLFVVALITIILVAFISSTRTDLLSTESYSRGMTADQLALGGLEQIKSDLQSEIADPANSSSSVVGGATTYWPLQATNAVPQRAGTTLNNDSILIKVSRAGTPFYVNGTSLASAVNSQSNPSSDGRYIPADRWSKPLLLTNTFNNFPDWINFTRTGPRVVTAAQASDATSSNTNYVTGRYAYVVYDTGGLIDINVAGNTTDSTDLTPAVVGRKGFLALADLTCLPNPAALGGTTPTLTQTQVNSLVEWRNKATYATSYNYLTNYASTNGFMRVSPGGDNTFLSRQDLIRYAGNAGITNTIPYLTTFSRELNAPSWRPATPAQSSIDYAKLSDTTTSANRNIPNVRFLGSGTITHYKIDGTGTNYMVTAGAPLIQQRFSLARMTWLNGCAASGNGPSSSFKNAIRACFGLVWNGSTPQCWIYTGSSGSGTTPASSIETLAQVAGELREPNFFELLKACILSGSIGQNPGKNKAASTPFIVSDTTAVMSDAHIIQIGVNMIDQTTTGNSPDTVVFCKDAFSTTGGYTLGYEFYGQKNLPYLTRAIEYLDGNPNYFNAGPPPANMNSWIQPELWWPYQNPGSAPVPQLQVTATGGVTFIDSNNNLPPPPYTTAVENFTTSSGPASGQVNPALVVNVSGFPSASPVPIALTTAQVSQSNSSNSQPPTLSMGPWYSQSSYPGASYAPIACFYTGSVAYKAVPAKTTHFYEIRPFTLSFLLQWSSDGLTWHTYSRMENIKQAGSLGLNAGSPYDGVYYRVDSRTDRFGNTLDSFNGWPFNQTIRPGAPATYQAKSTQFPPGNVIGLNLGFLTDNLQSEGTYYPDPDGIVRPGDGAYESSGGSTEGLPLYVATNPTVADGQAARRPLILNRPFQSVGEIGYTFRDLPGKQIDFFTAQSADAALLDVFSAYDEPPVVAGTISPNSIYPQTLQAVLQGALQREFNSTATDGIMLNTDAGAIAQSLTTYTQTTPFVNRADIVTGFSNTLTTTLASSAPGLQANKTEREAVMRALGSVSNTRTWNLLIDVIAQAGRYPKGTTSLNNFVVQAERRYWLHLAIDRYTGKVIDEQYEPVSE